MYRSISSLAILCTFSGSVFSEDYNSVQVGNMVVPFPQRASYDFKGSLDQVKIYGCSTPQQKRVNKALQWASDAASGARDLLDRPSRDPYQAGVTDAIFGNAFTSAQNRTDSIKFVRSIFDSM